MADDIGFIYLAVNDTMPGLVKIGLTKGDVRERMKELSSDTGVPAPFGCPYFCKVKNPAKVEKQLHEQFAFCRESSNREFFRVDWRAVKATMRMMSQADGVRLSESEPAKNDDNIGKFTLLKWVKKDDADKVRQVLAIGGGANQADEHNQTALMWAADLGYDEIANILLDGGADPNRVDKHRQTALMFSAERGHANIAKALLDYGANVDAEDKEGETALIKTWSADTVKVLLDGGANPNNDTLMRATANGNADAVRMLLLGGADPNTANSRGQTVLMIAAFAGHEEVAKVLLGGGANPNAKDRDGKTALMQAMTLDHAEIAKILRAAT